MRDANDSEPTIWKYETYVRDLTDQLVFDMPRTATVLSVANQNENLVIYALVNPNEKFAKRTFSVGTTGNPIKAKPGSFVGTALFMQGAFVVHIFEGAAP